MYIAMNRFRISLGSEEIFETMWRTRESSLDGMPGFRRFHLLRGATDDECTLYASHTEWESEEHFRAWTESDAFRKAHASAKAPPGTYLGHPVFEGFRAVLSGTNHEAQ